MATNVNVSLNLNSSQFVSGTAAARKATAGLIQTVTQLQTAVGRGETRVAGLVHRMRDLFVILGQARGSLRTVWSFTGQWTTAIIKQNAELERMTKLLSGLSRAAGQQARDLEAQSDMNWLIELSQMRPFAIDAMTDSLVKMRVAGLEDARKGVENLTNAVAAFGGDEAVLKRASIAIQQMAGKGVISMEELRQQLGEAVPSAMFLMAESMNMTMTDFVNLVSRGAVQAGDALERLNTQFGIMFGGRGAAMMDTAVGQMARFKVQTTLIAKEIGDAGFMSAFTDGLRNLNYALQSSEVRAFAQDLGEWLATAATALAKFLVSLKDFRSELELLVKAVAVFTAGAVAGKLLQWFGSVAAAALGASKAIAAFARTSVTSLALLGTSIRQGTSFKTFIGAVAPTAGRATSAITVLGGALRSLFASNPLGLTFLGIWGAYEVWDRLSERANKYKDAIEGVRDALKDPSGLVSEDELDAINNQIIEGVSRLEEYQRRIPILLRAGASGFKGDESWIREQLGDIRDELVSVVGADGETYDLTKEGFDRLLKLYQDYLIETNRLRREGLGRNEASAAAVELRKFTEGFEIEANAAQDIFRNALENLRKKFREGVGDEDWFREARRGVLLSWKSFLQEFEKQQFDESLPADQKAVLTKYFNEQNELVDDALVNLDRMPDITDTALQKQLEVFDTYVEGLQKRIAKVQGAYNGLGTTYAEFLARQEMGMHDGIDENDLANAKNLAIKLDFEIAKRKQINDLKKMGLELETAINRARADTASALAESSGDTLLGDSSGMVQARRFISEMETQLLSMIEAQKEIQRLTPEAFKEEILAEYEARLAQLPEMASRLFEEIGRGDAARFAADMRKVNEELARTIELDQATNRRDSLIVQYRQEVQKLSEEFRRQTAMAQPWSQEWTAAYQKMTEHISLLERQLQRDLRTPMQVMMEDWLDTVDEFENAWASAMQSLVDELMGFIETGKFELDKFAKHILKLIAEIMLKQLIAQMVTGIMGMWGGSSRGPIPTGFMVPGSGGQTPQDFYRPPGFAMGGIVDKPQLALFGEGSMAEAFVPLPDGKTIPVTVTGGMSAPDVTVNVINQSGQQVEASERGRRFDGRKMILDVVLEAAARPGLFRDSMRGAMK